MTQMTGKEIKEHDIIARKKQLKIDGLSGRQQIDDGQFAKWVTHMNELKLRDAVK